ncbi:MAG: hypothetical protein LBS43_06330 [Prevotellaceae bacterium]|jgi:hypothetical protein|nr:hypothetical protein [Prevotellaceae bacterium]
MLDIKKANNIEFDYGKFYEGFCELKQRDVHDADALKIWYQKRIDSEKVSKSGELSPFRLLWSSFEGNIYIHKRLTFALSI